MEKHGFKCRKAKMPIRYALLIGLLLTLAYGQETPGFEKSASGARTPSGASLSEDEIRQLIRESAERDMENDKKLRDYTYVERQEQHRLDRSGQVKSKDIKTYDVMMIYGEQVEKLIAKDDKPLSEKEAKKEEEKLQKLIDKRKNESEADRKQRLEKTEKEREDERRFVLEVADAYDFRYVGTETLDGRENHVIAADPKPGYQPHLKQAKILPKFRFRAWIDRDEIQWRKIDIQCVDTASFGLFLLRIHKGSRVLIEQTRINDEVWLPRHVALNADFRLALLKNFDFAMDITDRDYKKFRSETTITPLGEVSDSNQGSSVGK